MKLNVDSLRYLSKDDFRVLTAVEMGMRNHEIVPSELVDRIASLKHAGTYKVLKNLLKHKLVHHDASKYDGFRLTYLGYDFLAIKALVNRGVFTAVGRQIGVGKESDIFEVSTEDGDILAMKLHRLGRVSFRAVKSKRDYLGHRSNYNWLYLSRLAALKEYSFMKALGEHGFPVPVAVDCNRHCVIMSLVQGCPLVQVRQLQNPEDVFETILGLVVRLAEHGLIHCDFNEFNIMIDDGEKVTMIDFPQMVSVSHRNAEMYFDRDVECIYKFFSRRFGPSSQESLDASDDQYADSVLESEESGRPSFSSIVKSATFLDKELAASGFTRRDQDFIEKYIEGGDQKDAVKSDDNDDDDDNDVGDEDDNNDDDDGDHIAKDCKGMPIIATSMDTLNILEVNDSTCYSKNGLLEGNAPLCSSSIKEEHGISSVEEKELGQDPDGSEAVRLKRLSKHRQRAAQAVQGGKRSTSSRNSYKDKGRKNACSSLVHRQACKW